MFGFSVYLNGPLSSEKMTYIKRMKEAGFSGVFTSLQIPEEDSDNYINYLSELGNVCKNLNLALMVDVSSRSLAKLGLSFDRPEKLRQLGVSAVRADDGISPEEMAEASHQIHIALNASTLSKDEIVSLRNLKADFSRLTAWNNYYPHPHTGISESFLKKRTTLLHEYGIEVTGFVPGDTNLRQPIFSGLPTLESDRRSTPFVAALHLFSCGIDNVYIGDEGLKVDTVQQFKQYEQDQSILLFVENVNTKYAKWTIRDHENRPDDARDVFRSRYSRQWHIEKILPENTDERPAGSLTIDNQGYGRYAGEIEITKVDLPSDAKVNVVGRIREKDRGLLRYLIENRRVILQINQESE